MPKNVSILFLLSVFGLAGCSSISKDRSNDIFSTADSIISSMEFPKDISKVEALYDTCSQTYKGVDESACLYKVGTIAVQTSLRNQQPLSLEEFNRIYSRCKIRVLTYNGVNKYLGPAIHSKKSVKIIELLLRNGNNPSLVDNIPNKPISGLILSISQKQEDVALAILKHNPELASVAGGTPPKTPLQLAKELKLNQVVKALEKK